MFLIVGLYLSVSTFARKNCFLVKENNHAIVSEGNCKLRHLSCTTFKISISLMGYNKDLLIDEAHSELSFKECYDNWLEK